MLALVALTLVSAAPLKVGVTLHPYHSWASQVTKGLPIEVRAVLPGEVDVGSYQPRPQDVARLADLDVLVVNGLGHDDFIGPMLAASGNTRCRVVNLNDGTPLLPSWRGSGKNAHTFLSFGNAAAQSQLLARVLGELRPELKRALLANTSAWVKRLRAMRAEAVRRLSTAAVKRVVTVHDGYAYLLQELGLTLVDVVEPAHGLTPGPGELAALLGRLEAEPVKVVLSEQQFPAALAEVLRARGARVVVVSHVATGDFTPERFEQDMQHNVDALVSALTQGDP